MFPLLFRQSARTSSETLVHCIVMSFSGGKMRVLIDTTNGPVEVQLLTEEDAAIGRCVACIGGTTETADIASAYHAFVVRPTGVIEVRFGHSCYRLHRSQRHGAGSGWQARRGGGP